MPTEDLEDLSLLKKNYEVIEQYNFEEITNKYNLKDSIIALIFKKDQEVRILSRISIMGKVILKNQTFFETNISKDNQIENIIKDLKIVYEDYWKNFNRINTSIRLSLNIKVENTDNLKISKFEKI